MQALETRAVIDSILEVFVICFLETELVFVFVSENCVRSFFIGAISLRRRIQEHFQ